MQATFILYEFNLLLFQSKIASCPSATSNWFAYSEQKSNRIYLKKGTPYYLLANHVDHGGADHVAIAVSMDTTVHSNAAVGSAVDEIQNIMTDSVTLSDKQVRILMG